MSNTNTAEKVIQFSNDGADSAADLNVDRRRKIFDLFAICETCENVMVQGLRTNGANTSKAFGISAKEIENYHKAHMELLKILSEQLEQEKDPALKNRILDMIQDLQNQRERIDEAQRKHIETLNKDATKQNQKSTKPVGTVLVLVGVGIAAFLMFLGFNECRNKKGK